MKIKTPEEVAEESETGKDKFTLYLDRTAMEYMRKRAAKVGTSTSRLVNAAILAYMEADKSKKSD